VTKYQPFGARLPVTLQPLLQAGGRFADGRARHADQPRAPSASSILKGFALPVCASRFRPMVKTYVVCPDPNVSFNCKWTFNCRMSRCDPNGSLLVTWQALLQASDCFVNCRARHADQPRVPAAGSILKGFALPVCASRFCQWSKPMSYVQT
jgi:hypothetical protein